jgi:hypothetical protein
MGETIHGNEVDLTDIGCRVGGQYDSFSKRLHLSYRGDVSTWLEDVVFGKSPFSEWPNLQAFHLLCGKDLPSKQLVTEFNNKWKPIFKKMQEAPGITDKIPVDADESFVQQSFAEC